MGRPFGSSADRPLVHLMLAIFRLVTFLSSKGRAFAVARQASALAFGIYARSFSALSDPGLQLQSNHRTGTQKAPRTYDILNAQRSLLPSEQLKHVRFTRRTNIAW
jgi:hypothetical protein